MTRSSLRHTGRACAILAVATLASSMGCSDPAQPTPQAAFSAAFGNYGAVACPAKTPTAEISVGAVSAGEKSSVADGEDGAYISCKVTKSGDKLEASGQIRQGSTSLTLFPLTIAPKQTAKGSLQVSSATTLGQYAPPDGESCDFQLIDGDPGRIWLSFSCKHVTVAGSLQSDCSLYNGYIVFENCDE